MQIQISIKICMTTLKHLLKSKYWQILISVLIVFKKKKFGQLTNALPFLYGSVDTLL